MLTRLTQYQQNYVVKELNVGVGGVNDVMSMETSQWQDEVSWRQ